MSTAFITSNCVISDRDPFSPRKMKNNTDAEKWHSFSEVLHRLHAEGIYIHSEQLAEFFLRHGLPVDLQYVPAHLAEKATVINKNYQGDVAHLKAETDDSYRDFTELW